VGGSTREPEPVILIARHVSSLITWRVDGYACCEGSTRDPIEACDRNSSSVIARCTASCASPAIVIGHARLFRIV